MTVEMIDGVAIRGRRQGNRRGIWSEIAGAALPLYLTMIAASAGALVDTALLGNHSTAALAAFAVSLAVFSPATATVAGALRGVMPFATPYKDDADGLLPVVRTGTWLAIGIGVLAAAAVAMVPLIGRAAGVPRVTLDELGTFPYLLALSVLAIAVNSSAASILVAVGRSRQVMRAGLLGTAASVALAVLLVGGPGPLPSYGLTGAGVAMLASSVVSAFVNQRNLRRATVLAGRSLRPGRPDPARMWQLATVGVPLAGTVLLKFAVLGVLTFAAARLGTGAAAVHAIAISLANLIFTAAVAVGQATVPVVTTHAEYRDTAAIRRGVRVGTWLALTAVGCLALTLLALGPWAATLFTDDADVRRQLLALLPLLLAVVLTDAWQVVVGFGLIGLKSTVPSFVVMLLCYGILAALAVPLAIAGGLVALWTALALANLLQAVYKAYSFHQRSTFTAPRTPAVVGTGT